MIYSLFFHLFWLELCFVGSQLTKSVGKVCFEFHLYFIFRHKVVVVRIAVTISPR